MMLRFGAVAVAAALGMLVAVPLANADEGVYLNQVRPNNKLFVDLTNDQFIRLGHVACATLRTCIRSGMSLGNARNRADRAVASTATERLGLSYIYIDRASVMHITQHAEDYFC